MPSAVEEGVRAIGEPDTIRDARGVVIVEVRERTIEQSRRSHTSEARRSLQPTGNENSRHSGRRDSGDLDAILDLERVADELGRVGGVDEADSLNHEHRVGNRLPILDGKVIEPQKAVSDREALCVSTASMEKEVALERLASGAWQHIELLE